MNDSSWSQAWDSDESPRLGGIGAGQSRGAVGAVRCAGIRPGGQAAFREGEKYRGTEHLNISINMIMFWTESQFQSKTFVASLNLLNIVTSFALSIFPQPWHS